MCAEQLYHKRHFEIWHSDYFSFKIDLYRSGPNMYYVCRLICKLHTVYLQTVDRATSKFWIILDLLMKQAS